MNPRISVADLSFGFTASKPVLRGLHLSVEPAEAVIVTGSNGSGKSTLLALLAGILTPQTGTVTVASRPAHTRAGMQSRWYMTTEPALYRLLSVAEQLQFYASSHGVDPHRGLAVLNKLVAEDIKDRLCGELSTGQAQKVWFSASVAAHQAPVLLLDEPFSNVDEESIPLMVELLEEYRNSGGSIVMATHLHQHQGASVFPPAWHRRDMTELQNS